jgi:hypothetical protein
MSIPMVSRWLWPVLVLLVSACSQDRLLTKQDYRQSQNDFMQGNAAEALYDFPRRTEQGDFITTMEQGYLNLIQGKPEIRQMQQQADMLRNRVRYHVSREAKTFFYLQTPEDYYASEHEVIWLHFLLSWGYSLQGKYEDACVEAREAGSLLTLPWSPEGHFDDPAMRLFLAGLWTMCGAWQEAQVDLRAAWFMDHSLNWAKQLADRVLPPAQLFVVLGGPGPEPVWDPQLAVNPLRSGRQVAFKLRGRKSSISLVDSNGVVIVPQLSPDASNWYHRHLERESELHELIMDSAYGGKAAASSTLAGGKIAATTSLGLAVGLGGTALGAAIIRYGTGDALYYGLAVAGASIERGMHISQQGYEQSTSKLKQDLDPSISYRFVRYLPEYLWMGWSDQPVAFPVELRTPQTQVKILHPTVAGRTSVTVLQVPDAAVTNIYR